MSQDPPPAARLPGAPPQATAAPAGFPACARCPLLASAPVATCVNCAGPKLDPIPADACPVCRQRGGAGGRCRNRTCRDPRRRIERIDAISYLSGPFRRAIYQYKYEGAGYWAPVFARLLAGWLDADADADARAAPPPDLIIANPTHVPPGAPGPGHVETILRAAAGCGTWPIDRGSPAAVTKTRPTLKSSGQDTEIKHLAGADLRSALKIADPARVRGRRVLIFDDVCTTGSQLDTLAACLLDAGAAAVRGLVLARTPLRAS